MHLKMFKFTSLLIILSFTLAACGSMGSGAPTPTPLPPLVSYQKAIYNVEKGSIISEQEVSGEIVPSRQDELFFRAPGYVNRVSVKKGDTVKKGDILAELQIDDLLNQLQQAQIDLEVAQANLADYKSQQEFDIKKAEIDVAILEKRVEQARQEVENTWGKAREMAQLNLDIAELNLQMAQLAFEKATQQTNPYMEQAVTRSQLAVERLQGLIAERQIVASYDGIILKTLLRPGQQVDAFDVKIGIGDPTELVVRSPFDWDLRDVLHRDSIINMYMSSDAEEGYPVKYLPSFLPIRSSSEETSNTSGPEYMYYSLPDNIPVEDIPVGRSVFLKILLGKKDDALLLPPAAIREYKGFYFVIVVNGDTRRRVEIQKIGLKSPEKWEVFGDIQEGDQVLGP